MDPWERRGCLERQDHAVHALNGVAYFANYWELARNRRILGIYGSLLCRADSCELMAYDGIARIDPQNILTVGA